MTRSENGLIFQNKCDSKNEIKSITKNLISKINIL
jgi:hypothetical protein